jgi:hypothetical protein
MSERLRERINQPHFYTDALENGNQAVYDHATRIVEDAKPIVATQDHEAIAYDVAEAIKPDVDYVVSLEKQKKAHNPLESAAYVEIEGKTRVVGAKAFEGEPNLAAAKADLERNAKNAAEIATEEHLDGADLKLARSKQKVANMRTSQS